jgi:CheY-like chemotaxis protein
MATVLPLVLYAEDEESDGLILRRAFQKASLRNPLTIVRDGQEAIHYLSGASPYGDRHQHPLPSLILLDLKMPLRSGFDVLSWIAGSPDLRRIPVVVLSSSPSETDIRHAREMGARDYLVKPNGLDQYAPLVQALHSRWLS